MRGREREEVCEARSFSSDQRAYQFFAGSRLLSQRIKCGTRAAWIAIDNLVVDLLR
jgi:hypothetical protein